MIVERAAETILSRMFETVLLRHMSPPVAVIAVFKLHLNSIRNPYPPISIQPRQFLLLILIRSASARNRLDARLAPLRPRNIAGVAIQSLKASVDAAREGGAGAAPLGARVLARCGLGGFAPVALAEDLVVEDEVDERAERGQTGGDEVDARFDDGPGHEGDGTAGLVVKGVVFGEYG